MFRRAEPTFRGWLAAIDQMADALLAIGLDAARSPPPAPRWRQGWFAGLDAAMAYALVRLTAPERIVEVGSGHSTRFLVRAVQDGGLATAVTAIDPQPRADLMTLPVTAHRVPVQRVEPDLSTARPRPNGPAWARATSCSSIRATSPCPGPMSTG